MRVAFTKMHGAGNDFVVIDGRDQTISLDAAKCRELGNRHTGIGFDQLLLIENDIDADVLVRIFNADGTEVGQCGNGLRCVAAWLSRREGHERLRLNGRAGITEAVIETPNHVGISLPVPDFSPAASGCNTSSPVTIDGDAIGFDTVYIGNPHAVVTVKDVAKAPVDRLGAALQRHFEHGVNVGFSGRCRDGELHLRVFERGVGETQACGSGACAAALVAMRLSRQLSMTTVRLPGGQLMVRWAGEGEPVWLHGPAEEVFEGQF